MSKQNSLILGLIPARGGSKGVPRKNIRIVAGKPLIAWTIETALSCPSLDRVIVTTDDEEIAKIAKECGADVPFIRPRELALDNTPDFPVFQHVISWLSENENFHSEIICWLRPTLPLRIVQDVEEAIELFTQNDVDCVRSVCPATHYHPYTAQKIEGNRLKPFIEGIDLGKYHNRQMLPDAYYCNGAVDVIRCKTALERKHLFAGDMQAYTMPLERSVDIDNEIDFTLAETLLKKRKRESVSES